MMLFMLTGLNILLICIRDLLVICRTYFRRVPPEWLTLGRTVLAVKDVNKGMNPANFRPVTCLPTVWKSLTSILAAELYEHLSRQNLISFEQKDCARSSQGPKDQLLIDHMRMSEAKWRHKNLEMIWIDYQKAFDSVPHSWLLQCLNLYKVHQSFTDFLKNAMSLWHTQLTLNNVTWIG